MVEPVHEEKELIAMDTFDEMINDFLVPMEDFQPPVMSSTYFFRRDGSFVFAEGYTHPPEALWGMIIKYPSPDGHIDIFGRRYSWTHRVIVDGELTMIPSEEQVLNQFKVAPELAEYQGEKPPYARYFVKFPLSDFKGYFDPRHSMKMLRRKHDFIDRAVIETCDFLDIVPENTGVTGSLSYGLVEDDIDIMFIGSPEENAAIAARIRGYLRDNPPARVFELGKEWPLRFYFADTLICPFFRYDEPSRIPLLNCEMDIVSDEVAIEGVVVEDTHNLYLPSLVRLAAIRGDGLDGEEEMELILYHGALRGEVWEGDRISARPALVKITVPGRRPYRALLVVDPKQIETIDRV